MANGAPGPAFTLKDRQGNEHAYHVTPHPASEGHTLAWAIQGLGVRPILQGLRTIAQAPEIQRVGQALQGEVQADANALMADAAGGIVAALGQLDMGPLSEAIESVLSHPKLPDLAREVLKYTYRDGKSLGNAADAQLHYSQAYQANYGEMMQAVVRVALHNDFFPVATLFSSLSSDTPPAQDAA